MLTFLILAVPLAPLTANDTSIQTAVPIAKPDTTALQVNGNLFVVLAPSDVIAPPLVVPVKAALNTSD